MAVIVLSTRGTLGDHIPGVELGRALLAAGHRVRLAVNGAQRSLVERAGLEFRSIGYELGPEQARNQAWVWDQWHNPLADRAAEDFGDRAAAAELDYIRRLEDICDGADLLIASTTTANLAEMVAERQQISWIHVSPMAMAFHEPPSRPDPVWFTAFLDRLRGDLGLSAGAEYPPLADILASSRWFSRPHAERRVVQTGFWFAEAPGRREFTPSPQLARFLQRSPLVLTLSSQPVTDPAHVVDLHVRAAELLDRPLIVQRGWADLHPIGAVDPDRVQFIDSVPHSQLFPHAAAVLTHGGIGTLAAAMRVGCPIAVEPYGNDQIFNAQRVRALGIGTGIHPHRATPEKLAEILEARVLTPQTRSRALALVTRVNAEPGLPAAVRTILDHLPTNGSRPTSDTIGKSLHLGSEDTIVDVPGWTDQINDAELDPTGPYTPGPEPVTSRVDGGCAAATLPSAYAPN
ncbi:glycosyltransferase [Nocardia sp. CA-119907]|uniref:glycosyltransferase n=1 Tax=Nocardia sp. CA-119907 TaxID=3239973 RepID=UPI003D956A50